MEAVNLFIVRGPGNCGKTETGNAVVRSGLASASVEVYDYFAEGRLDELRNQLKTDGPYTPRVADVEYNGAKVSKAHIAARKVLVQGLNMGKSMVCSNANLKRAHVENLMQRVRSETIPPVNFYVIDCTEKKTSGNASAEVQDRMFAAFEPWIGNDLLEL